MNNGINMDKLQTWSGTRLDRDLQYQKFLKKPAVFSYGG